MADPGTQEKAEGSEKQPSPNVDTKNMDKTMPQERNIGTQSTTGDISGSDLNSKSNELWNSMSYWYYMQSYYQYYYSVCYFYTYYYWQMASSPNNTAPQAGIPTMAYEYQGQQADTQRPAGPPPPLTRTSCEARISSLQKRVVAEILDFFFLFFTKFLVFSIFYNNTERYSQLQYTLIIDENTSLKELEEILIQALVYRLMVFGYETIFIVGGMFGSLGGATPGKYFMGLSVVSAESIELQSVDARGEQVRIMPGGNPGWWRASVRALVKNFSMTFLFPIFITVFFFQHNQTIYDIIAGTAVVENGQRNQQRQ